jgi:membrane-bound serine protease (ClpP class)
MKPGCNQLVLLGFLLLTGTPGLAAKSDPPTAPSRGKVYIVPIREDIMPPMVYVVRRGVKEAMEAKADALVLDMNTDGGRVDVTEEIIQILNRFPGRTATFVNHRAFSAGAFISVATQEIYMAPQSVIGAAAPIMMSPGGAGVEKMPDVVEAKTTSAIRALVRTQAEKNGHNVEVIEAMIDRTKNLTVDGEVLNREGNILTLTDRQAAKSYGTPPKPLLSSGTVESMEAVLMKLGFPGAERIEIKPTGAEKLGFWINSIAPLLLIIGLLGLYIEFKTPGFGLPGIVGIAAFLIYFLGGYIAGVSAPGWVFVFVLGVILVLAELLIFPGTFFLGIAGGVLILMALILGMADVYPNAPATFSLAQLQDPLRDLSLAVIISLALGLILARFLPKTTFIHNLISPDGGRTPVIIQETQPAVRVGQTGTTVSRLSPGGKALFDGQLIDVLTRGEWVEKGRAVKVIGHSGPDAIVEEIA